MNKHIRSVGLDALSKVLNGPDPDKDMDNIYIPNAYLEVLVSCLIRDAVEELAPYFKDAEAILFKRYSISKSPIKRYPK